MIKLGQEAVMSEEDMLASPLRVMVITLFMAVVKEEINGIFFLPLSRADGHLTTLEIERWPH